MLSILRVLAGVTSSLSIQPSALLAQGFLVTGRVVSVAGADSTPVAGAWAVLHQVSLRGGAPVDSALTDRAGRYRGYIDNCAIPTLLVNRRWLWALDERTHHDLHIGIDVLHGQAGLTFVYDGGRRIYFNHCRGARPERLSAQQIRTEITSTAAMSPIA